ncbi:MAG: hypothetical protein L0207_00170 [Chlamydiae bacterium]|nr:hypothetical protein [Chlamydiota bacterium]
MVHIHFDNYKIDGQKDLRPKWDQKAPTKKFPLSQSDKKGSISEKVKKELHKTIASVISKEKNDVATAPCLPPSFFNSLAPENGFEVKKISEVTAIWQELFDKMVGILTSVHKEGIQETIITLNSPEFSNSPFFGTKISIVEYTTTAPKIFNIHFFASEQPLSLIKNNAAALVAALNGANLPFQIGRIDTSLQTLPTLEKNRNGREKEQESSRENE